MISTHWVKQEDRNTEKQNKRQKDRKAKENWLIKNSHKRKYQKRGQTVWLKAYGWGKRVGIFNDCKSSFKFQRYPEILKRGHSFEW